MRRRRDPLKTCQCVRPLVRTAAFQIESDTGAPESVPPADVSGWPPLEQAYPNPFIGHGIARSPGKE
jgi:hypothetical protein